MSLDTLFKQKKQDTQETVDDGEFRSRAEDESTSIAAESARTPRTSKANKRTNQNRRSTQDDSALPEKKRARRRLIGAIALVLAAVIGLPMLFESEPKSTAPKISIEIPSKDAGSPVQVKEVLRTPLPEVSASQAVAQSIDKSEEIISTPSTKPSSNLEQKPTNDTTIAKVDAGTKPAIASEKKPEVKEASNGGKLPQAESSASKVSDHAKKPESKLSETKTAEVKLAEKTPTKPTEKPEAKSEPKKESKDEAARAMALLEGRSESSPKSDNKLDKSSAKPAGSFSVQVAAMSSAAKIKELQSKLKSADIQTYTQKIHTDNGEVIRIRVGPFSSKAEAEKMQKKLVKLGLNGSLIPN